MAGGVTIEQRGAVIEVVLDNGDGNLLTIETCESLTGLLTQPPADAHVVHLRAEGPNFCLGRERGADDVDGLRREADALVALNRALGEGQLVTVAEVQGDAAGFGAGLAALCDISLAAPSAQIWFPEVNIDLAPAVVLAWLPRRVGRSQAFLMAATGRPVDARTAAAMGLVTEVADSDDALPKLAAQTVAALTERNPRVHREIKSFLTATADMTEAQAYRLAVERLMIGSMRRRKDVAEHGPSTKA